MSSSSNIQQSSSVQQQSSSFQQSAVSSATQQQSLMWVAPPLANNRNADFIWLLVSRDRLTLTYYKFWTDWADISKGQADRCNSSRSHFQTLSQKKYSRNFLESSSWAVVLKVGSKSWINLDAEKQCYLSRGKRLPPANARRNENMHIKWCVNLLPH